MHRWGDVSVRMTFSKIAVAATAALAAACGGSTTTTTISEVTGPSAVRCQTSVNTPATVPYAGSSVTLNVVAPRECSWTVTNETSWVHVAPASGQGEASVTATVEENGDARSRTGTLVINDTRVSVTQEAAPCRYQLGSSEARMSPEGGRTETRISTAGGCTWSATSSASWARVLTASGSGTATVEVEVGENSGAERTATVAIAGQQFTIVQAARLSSPPPPPPPPPPACSSATLDSSERSFAAAGGNGSVRVIAPPACSWTATADSPWISLNGSSGTGPGTVNYGVAANTTTSSRTGVISIAGRTHTVRQDAAAPSNEERPIEVSGHAILVDGSCPNLSFMVEVRRIFTTADTRFRGGSCRDVRTGVEVRVEGRVQSDGRIRATEVRVRDDD